MKSILHDKKEGTCYLCKLLYFDYSVKKTTEHHIICGTSGRKMSERYGLKVYLCSRHHGEKGSEDVHRPDLNDYDDLLRRIAQSKFEQTHTRKEWRDTFIKSYL